MPVFCGIDPGLTGALAFLNTDAHTLAVFDMPTIEITVGNKSRREIRPDRLAEIVDQWNPHHSLIEKVHSTPNDGHVGAFIFGKATGIVYGVFAGINLNLDQVTPAKWKKDMRVPADKDDALLVASRLFPNCTSYWNRKKDHGRGEAALIALYHAIQHGFSPTQPIVKGT
jgi:Holliday junction resolvasome RuvABC endonuclease subunit